MDSLGQPGNDFDNLLQKLDDIDAELETQTDYLGTIKLLLTLLVLLTIPIVLFLIYIFYLVMNPRVYF